MAEHEGEDLYAVLGVNNKATPAEIQAAFKKRARELHPDVNKAPDAEERFKRLVAAYDVLKDEQKRARYDTFGTANLRGRRPHKPKTGEREKKSGAPKSNPFDDLGFDNPFDFVLRRQQRKGTKREREVQLGITLEQAFQGTTLSVTLESPSAALGGEPTRFKIRIPAGAKEGDRLRIKEPAVVCVLRVEPHAKFELSGRDITTTIELAPWESALGAEIELSTPGGLVKVRVPPGTSSGQKLRLRGQGLPVKAGKDGEPGDLYVRLKIVFPKVMTQRERELWSELARLSNFDPRS